MSKHKGIRRVVKESEKMTTITTSEQRHVERQITLYALPVALHYTTMIRALVYFVPEDIFEGTKAFLV